MQLWKNRYVQVLIIAEVWKQAHSSEACRETRVGSVVNYPRSDFWIHFRQMRMVSRVACDPRAVCCVGLIWSNCFAFFTVALHRSEWWQVIREHSFLKLCISQDITNGHIRKSYILQRFPFFVFPSQFSVSYQNYFCDSVRNSSKKNSFIERATLWLSQDRYNHRCSEAKCRQEPAMKVSPFPHLKLGTII